MKKINLILLILMYTISVIGQDTEQTDKKSEKVYQTFKDTRIINSPSIETLEAGKMDFRIAHRFGDIAGDAGGWTTFYGLEEAADVMIGFEYGLSDNATIGINRTKGSGPLRQLVNGSLKLRIINQEIKGNQPFSLTAYGMGTYSSMEKSTREDDLNFFAKGQHRFSYHMQLIMARKFSPYFSFQFGGGWTYRNIVPFNDQNDLVHVSAATRIQFTKSIGIVVDAVVPFGSLRNETNADTGERNFYPALGIGLEWETGGGHVFQMNLTNSTGIAETDYIPYTTKNWLDGEYRLGFTISRLFTVW